jgi:hypothetical protein
MRKFKSTRPVIATNFDGSAPPPPNPYFMAFLTAILAGLVSVVGSYFAAGLQARHAIAQKVPRRMEDESREGSCLWMGREGFWGREGDDRGYRQIDTSAYSATQARDTRHIDLNE